MVNSNENKLNVQTMESVCNQSRDVKLHGDCAVECLGRQWKEAEDVLNFIIELICSDEDGEMCPPGAIGQTLSRFHVKINEASRKAALIGYMYGLMQMRLNGIDQGVD